MRTTDGLSTYVISYSAVGMKPLSERDENLSSFLLQPLDIPSSRNEATL